MGVLGAGQAQAVVVTVDLGQGAGPQQWNVTTFVGSYITNSAKFATPPAPGRMPWWGREALARQFTTAVNVAFGYPNFEGNAGPLFGWRNQPSQPTNIEVCLRYTPGTSTSCNTNVNSGPSDSLALYTWAQADLVPPVPGPLPALGAAAAFGFSRKLRQRIKVSNAVGASITAV